MRQERHSATRALRAFSLVELLFVLTIMGITSAIAVPRYSGFIAKNRLNAAVTRVKADLEAARQKAKHKGASQTVVFDLATSSYSITGWKSPDHKSVAYVVELSDDPYRAKIINVVFGADTTIIFDGFGEPDSNGSLEVQVGAFSQDITVSTSTNGVINVIPNIKVN